MGTTDRAMPPHPERTRLIEWARPTAVSTTGNPANCSPPTKSVHERPDSPEDNHG
jgi:hypothetical protein